MENTVSDTDARVARDSGENVYVNTRALGNPVKAVSEGSLIFRFERPISRKGAKCNRKTRRFWCRISISHGVNMDWTLDYPLDSGLV